MPVLSDQSAAVTATSDVERKYEPSTILLIVNVPAVGPTLSNK